MSDLALAEFRPNGTMSPDEQAYIARPIEDAMFSHLTASRWVLLLGPHKYGKSSALMRLRVRLKSSGYACAFVDAQRHPRSDGAVKDYATFLEWFTERIAEQVGAELAAPARRHRADLQHWLSAALPSDLPNVAIIIDEASGVPDQFKRDFYSQLRVLFNMRDDSDQAGFELAERIVCTFAGTFRPSKLIQSNKNSPFNVSELHVCDDLTLEEMIALARLGLGGDGEHYARLAFTHTEGHPYYVQRLFAAVQTAEPTSDARAAAFSAELQNLYDGGDGHLEELIDVVERDQELLALLPQILAGTLKFQGGDRVYQFAEVSGAARKRDGRLIVRNPIYRQALAHLASSNGNSPSERFPSG
jgi:AAA-like domain